MAQEIIGFKLEINGQEKVIGSVGEMKKLLKEANFELLSAQQNFGEYSQEAINAAKNVANLKDSIQEAAETSQLFDPGKKFQAFAGALSAVAGGFTAVQGALGLLGVESENVQKSLLKVQSALALSQGLSTVADSVKDFQRLAAVIQSTTLFQKAYNIATVAAAAIQRAFGVAVTTTSVAFKALRAAIISTGIGALVVAVGLLVEQIINWVNSASAAEKAQEKLAASTKKMNSEIDNQIAVLTALGGKEEEIYQLRLKRNENELNVLRNKLKTQGKLTEEELEQFRKLKTDKEVLDIQEQNRIKKNQEEEAKRIADNNKKQLDANKELADKRKQQREAERKQIEDDTKAAFDKARETANEVFLAEIKDKRMQDEIKIAQQYEADRKEIEQSKATQAAKNAALLALDAKYKQDLAAIKATDAEKKAKEDEDELTRILEQLNKENELTAFYLERDKKLKEEYNAADLEATKELQQRKFEAVNAGIDLIGALAGKSEVVGNILYTIQKAIEIGKIISSTSSAIAQVSASTAAVPAILPPGVPNPAFPIAVSIGAKKIAGLKIAAGASIASIVASSIAKFKGGGVAAPPTQAASAAASGGTGGAAPIAPAPPLVNTRTQLDSQSIQQLGSATNRAYVVESDITNSQERIRRINRAARLS
jgi:hypothetical protein